MRAPRWAGLRNGASNGADNVAIQLLLNFDVIICRAFLDPVQAGLYLSVNRLTNAAHAGFPVLTSVFLPAMAGGLDSPGARRAAKLLALAALAIAIAWNMVMWTLQGPIVTLLFGSAFAPAGEFLGPLALAIGARYLSMAPALKLIVLRRQVAKAVATLASIGAGVAMLALWYYVGGGPISVHHLIGTVIAVYAMQSMAHWALSHWYSRRLPAVAADRAAFSERQAAGSRAPKPV